MDSPILPYVKIAVLGACHTGKTSLVSRLCTGEFSSSKVYVPTEEPSSQLTTLMNADFKIPLHGREVEETGIEAKFVVCPSGADEDQLRRVLEETFCVIIVYDVTDRSSFDEARQKWASAVANFSPQSFKMLVGCKIDMVSKIAVDWTELSANASDMFFLEVSAADRTNVDLISNVIYLQARRLIKKQVTGVDVLSFEESDEEDNAEKKRYDLHLKQGFAQENLVLKDLQKICGAVSTEQASTIQEIMNAMPFTFTKSLDGSSFNSEAKTPITHGDFRGENLSMYSSPLGDAMNALVDRLTKERFHTGVHISSENSGYGSKGGMLGEGLDYVDESGEKYAELKEAFGICGIQIEPPFPSQVRKAPEALPPPERQVPLPPPLPPSSLLKKKVGPEKATKTLANSGDHHVDATTGLGKPPDKESPSSDVAGKSDVSPQPRHNRGGKQRPMKREVLVIKVKLPGDRGEALIHARQGDSPVGLAGTFISKHGLGGGDATLTKLAKLIHSKVGEAQMRPSITSPSKQGAHRSTSHTHNASPDRETSQHTSMALHPSGSRSKSMPSTNPTRSTGDRTQTQGEGGRRILVKLEIALGRTGKTGKIVIRLGDDAHDLVTEFCRDHPGIFTARQAEHLEGQVSKVISERSGDKE